MPSITKGYADTSLGQVHYHASQAIDEALPIIMLHQTASSSAMYQALMHALADSYWCIAPDTPGYGGTDLLAREVSVSSYAQVVYECLAFLDIDSCYLFGHHTGAAIAVQLVYEHPELVKKLALAGPPLLSPDQKQALGAHVKAMQIEEDGSHLTAVWQRIRGRFPDAPLELTHREALLSIEAGQHYHQTYQAVFEQDFAAQLAAIECPTLVFAGEDDTLRASLEPAYELLQQGEMHTIPEAGTYICDTHPDVVAALLSESFC